MHTVNCFHIQTKDYSAVQEGLKGNSRFLQLLYKVLSPIYWLAYALTMNCCYYYNGPLGQKNSLPLLFDKNPVSTGNMYREKNKSAGLMIFFCAHLLISLIQ